MPDEQPVVDVMRVFCRNNVNGRRIMRLRIVVLFMTLGIIVGLTPYQSENKVYLNIFETAWKKVNDT
jgi:hypothetical protein